MTRISTGRMLITALLAITPAAWAQGPRFHDGPRSEEGPGGRPRGGDGMRHGGRHWVMRDLDLTRDQMEKMRDLRQKHMPQMREVREELRKRQRELARLFAEGAREEKIREKNSQISELRKKLADIAASSMAEMSKILTSEQRAKFAAKMGQLEGEGFPPPIATPEPGPSPVVSPATRK